MGAVPLALGGSPTVADIPFADHLWTAPVGNGIMQATPTWSIR